MRVFDLLKNRIEKMEEKRDIKGLILALQDEDEQIRQGSAHVLGKLGSKEAVQPLIHALHDPDKEVKEEAITALGKIKDPKAVPALVKNLNSPRTTIRWRAAQALGKIGSKKAVEPLTLTLQDPDKDVKEEAIDALGRIAIKPLLNDLESNEAIIKEEAIVTINMIPEFKNSRIAKDVSKNNGPQESRNTSGVNKDQDEPVETFKTANALSDFEHRKELLLKDGHYTLIQNFVRKSSYDYLEDFSQKINYDYQLKDLQKLKDLLEYKGVEFQDQEMLWLIRGEIKEVEYQKFKNKMCKSQPSTLNQFLQNYIINFHNQKKSQDNSQNQDNLKRLLGEHEIPTKNLKKQIQQTIKQREIEEFENQLMQLPLKNSTKQNSPSILKEFIKKDLRDKRAMLISSEDYNYIENFVRKSKYDYQFSDVSKLKDLLKQRGMNFSDEELLWFIREEIKEQDYQDFKDHVLKNQPATLEEYLENYIKNYYPKNLNDTQNLENLQKLLQDEKIPSKNLKKQIEQTIKQKELEEFENEILQTSTSQTIPPLESQVTEDKALKNAQILYNLGNLFYDLERPDEALKYYNKSINTYPEIIESWKNKGLLFYILGRPQKATACYNHILTLNHDYGEVWLDIGVILYEMGKLNEAQFCYDKAQKMKTRDIEEIGSDTRQFLEKNTFYHNIFKNFIDLFSHQKLEQSSDSLSPISKILEMINHEN